MKQKNERRLTHNDEYVKVMTQTIKCRWLYEVRFAYFSPNSPIRIDHRLTRYFADYDSAFNYGLSVMAHKNRFWSFRISAFRLDKSVSFLPRR